MRNYTARKNTFIGRLDKDIPFVKKGEVVGNWEKGKLRCRGFLRTHSERFNKDQYSLFIESTEGHIAGTKSNAVLLNVPTWYGEQLEDDFTDSGLLAEDFFKDAWIKSIEMQDTKYGTKTAVITIYEN